MKNFVVVIAVECSVFLESSIRYHFCFSNFFKCFCFLYIHTLKPHFVYTVDQTSHLEYIRFPLTLPVDLFEEYFENAFVCVKFNSNCVAQNKFN
jgi:hypothetical protein